MGGSWGGPPWTFAVGPGVRPGGCAAAIRHRQAARSRGAEETTGPAPWLSPSASPERTWWADSQADDGLMLGSWVGERRVDRKAGRLSGDRIAALDELGFVWDGHKARLDRGLAALQAFIDEHGHARVPRSYRADDGFTLGTWVQERRRDLKAGRLSDERITALDELGLTW